MNTGYLKAIAEIWYGEAPFFRLQIGLSDGTWEFIYVPASNYQFHKGDFFSWDGNKVVWHPLSRNIVLCTIRPEVKR